MEQYGFHQEEDCLVRKIRRKSQKTMGVLRQNTFDRSTPTGMDKECNIQFTKPVPKYGDKKNPRLL